jgi:hypothetical protein
VSVNFSNPKRIVTIAAASVVVAGFMATPVAAVAAVRAPAVRLSASYAHVGRSPRLPATAHLLGATSSAKKVSGTVALAPRDPAALEQAAKAVSDPRSPDYRHYLDKGTFASAYGPTPATIDAIKSVLTRSHLSVTSVSSDGLLVRFSGTAGAADAAFRTHLANYRLASGRVGTETTTPVSFPSSVASQVVSVVGLDTLPDPASSLEHATHPAAVKPVTHHLTHYAGGPSACAKATGAADSLGGLTDDQIANAYGVDGLYKQHDTGAGQGVAIYELEPFSTTDLKAFDTCYYGAAAATTMAGRVHQTTVDGGAGTGEGSGEAILDVEDVSGIAPGANIDVYTAPNTTSGGLDAYDRIITSDTDKVISTSWGFCELDEVNLEPGYINVENDLFEQAALQGQTLFASAGDAGSDDCAYDSATPAAPTLSVDDPGSQPFVTGVGGTTITDEKSSPTEQIWNDGSTGGGGGGGVSTVWGAPSWQQPFLDTAAAAATSSGASCAASPTTAATCREVPDVSAQADEYTGAITVYVAEYGGWTTFGGTSSATPLWAAMLADIDASTTCAGHPVGFASPSLYAIASIPADYKASFNDITSGNNDVYDLFGGTAYSAHTGYDMASGLGTPLVTGLDSSGSPTKAGLAVYLCQLAGDTSAARPTVTSLTPAAETTTPVGPLIIHGTNLTHATRVSIGGYDLPTSSWSATSATTITVTTVPTAAQADTDGLGPQSGAGRAIVSVTASAGAGQPSETSLATAAGSLLYVANTVLAPRPSVSGITAFGGRQSGGNTVKVYGSSFTGALSATVGGVAATAVTAVPNTDGTELTMVVPAYASGTTGCAATGTDPATDVCQSQVVVTNANGSSTTTAIVKPYVGAPFTGVSGGVPEPSCVADASCEIVPSDTEYDYFATPAITSITTTSTDDTTAWASELGTTIATIDGKGFDTLGFDWVDVGNPSLAANNTFGTVNVTPTQVQVAIPARDVTHGPDVKAISVQMLAGLSNQSSFTYAGIPSLTSISPSAGPDVGGTTFHAKGANFLGVAPADGGEVSFAYAALDGATNQLSGYTASSATEISGKTPSSNPGAFVAEVCTVTGCSEPTSQKTFDDSLFDFFEPGNPVITSVSAHRGPASGGTKLIITGTNLSDAILVTFGQAVAEATSAPEILTNGSNTQVSVTAPPGHAGSKVNIRITTVESVAAAGGHRSAVSPQATFTYTSSVAAPPRDVTGTKHGTRLDVKWKAPASNGGHGIIRYRVSAVGLPNSPSPKAKRPPTVTVTTKNGKARSAKLTKLRAGWTYFIEVKAVNKKGRSSAGRSTKAYFIHDPA